jgi:hypothetical protein
MAYYDDWYVDEDEPDERATYSHCTAVFAWSLRRGAQLRRIVVCSCGDCRPLLCLRELSADFAQTLVFVGGNDDLLCSLLGHFCRIRELTITRLSSGSKKTTDAALAGALRKCPLLKKVYIGGRHFTSAGNNIAETLANYCAALEELRMPRTNISDEGLAALAQCSTNLRVLDVESCRQLTMRGFEISAMTSPSLQKLSFASNNDQQAKRIQELFSNRPVTLNDDFLDDIDYRHDSDCSGDYRYDSDDYRYDLYDYRYDSDDSRY